MNGLVINSPPSNLTGGPLPRVSCSSGNYRRRAQRRRVRTRPGRRGGRRGRGIRRPLRLLRLATELAGADKIRGFAPPASLAKTGFAIGPGR